ALRAGARGAAGGGGGAAAVSSAAIVTSFVIRVTASSVRGPPPRTRHGRVAHDGVRAVLLLALPEDLPLRGVHAGLRVLHLELLAEDRLVGGTGRDGERDNSGDDDAGPHGRRPYWDGVSAVNKIRAGGRAPPP